MNHDCTHWRRPRSMLTLLSLFCFCASTGVAVPAAIADDVPIQINRLTAPDGQAYDLFGADVAIDAEAGRVLIGAPAYYLQHPWEPGSAYLFDLNTGHLLITLEAADGTPDQEFGLAVALRGGVAVIGAAGDIEAVAYTFDTSTGEQLAKLKPDDSTFADRFGSDVATNGEVAIIGAPIADGVVDRTGAVYIMQPRTGSQLMKMIAPDGEDSDFFGHAVAVDGDRVLIGAPGDVGTPGWAGRLTFSI